MVNMFFEGDWKCISKACVGVLPSTGGANLLWDKLNCSSSLGFKKHWWKQILLIAAEALIKLANKRLVYGGWRLSQIAWCKSVAVNSQGRGVCAPAHRDIRAALPVTRAITSCFRFHPQRLLESKSCQLQPHVSSRCWQGSCLFAWGYTTRQWHLACALHVVAEAVMWGQ